ncbi:MAG: hypothetical protein ACKPKO_30935 [Candidatus Fonsibacter sp.]
MNNQNEYNIYVSMLDDEELECLKYVQRLREYTNRQLFGRFPDGYRQEHAREEEEGEDKEGWGR